jgi:hypothetical protein
MSGEERGTRAAAVLFDARARSQYGDPAVGERICGAALGHQQRRAKITFQVLGVLSESADEEDWVSVVKGGGHERAIGTALRLESQGAQVPVEIWAINVRARSAFVGVGMSTSYSGPACCLSVERVHLRS